ncbi:TPA: aspartate--tRNA(Asn) ligase [Candidatus Daviesbacteria bacterium]|nr:MAG: aspartate-tRNA ligase [Candidatus Daviesbacteria bacterium GW2011_GWA2_38_17]OGE28014.1 MAG: aspartate--tRNA(Asn) ligase [Candidatus Daviesbacteria bacterium RIFCSPHIGHO2_02_FULL_39_41]OGE44277.1 MAG: aspartate--tRNA(Asn) ligase [Candidatus Daviesbacteria bacterium RIFCSPHIGHO2_12_FULL_38_25]OGE68961.1 MAG: aspartate--tRNA(Asn) ligase [Candidatus Daviesbacteria bacterium RIFCSPLOWO2_02_FULL_38_18]OGE73188.1 MAG: aspartate--tRNA(Asn) ligase [Candidatus Daviesbacteria bacterium RIFCSPLOWO
MERTLILDCNNKIGEKVKICGWVQVRRDHGKILFLDVLDRSGLIQVVIPIGVKLIHPPGVQDVVCIEGKVDKRPPNLVNKNIPTGEIEISAEHIEVLSKAAELPFDMGGKELDLQLPTLLDFRSLTLRHPKIKEIFKAQAAILEGFRKAASDLGCTEIVVPTIVAGATEGGAEVFKIDYFDHKAYLSQSPQLYKQMLVPVYERVFTIAKAYRAEPSVTTRHLAEATQLDIEIGFVEFEDLLDFLEEVAVKMLKFAEDFGVEQIAFGKIPRLTLRKAQDLILKEFGRDNRKEKDLTPQDEVDLCKWALEKHKSDFVTVTHFPTSAKPFYTMPDPAEPEYSLSYDLLFRGVEILSGSQRINDYEQLVKSIESRGMDPKNFEMYLQAFKYGMPPEGGFSFGLERVTMHVLGLANVREASLFPRDMERVDVRL